MNKSIPRYFLRLKSNYPIIQPILNKKFIGPISRVTNQQCIELIFVLMPSTICNGVAKAKNVIILKLKTSLENKPNVTFVETFYPCAHIFPDIFIKKIVIRNVIIFCFQENTAKKFRFIYP